ncbi:NAD(P)H-dependent oxidoreductase [Candidatus Lokiarchaeum ossiferum]|uniref:NAD(P)H-dependent oxidoreductase n=1 Tax=Candidatus Lokiarchaeum ossiferum TaxID=2951803 RepID=UPI00352F8672
MKILYLNGSPKGDNSVTLQYLLYLKKKFPDHNYKVWHIAQKIKSIEKQPDLFQEILKDVKSAEGIIWGFPLYCLLLPSQFKRFIELIFEGGKDVQDKFKGKYTVALSTSIHFYDHTCHNYMQAICDDLDMKYVGKFSADTWDILNRKNRPTWLAFGKKFFSAIQDTKPTIKGFMPLFSRDFSYIPTNPSKKNQLNGKKLVLIVDNHDSTSNIGKMIEQFQSSFDSPIITYSHEDIDLKFPCIGCMKCGYDNRCSYDGKDGFNEFWRNNLMDADIIVFAGEMKDRYLSSQWKQFLDRAYFRNHTPSFTGKQFGMLISGPLSQNSNLKEIIQGFAEFQQTNLVGIITDEFGDSKDIDALILNFADELIYNANQKYIAPHSFHGVASQKIFRDDVYGRLRFVCQADHRHYKTNGYYQSFPQNNKVFKKINRKMMFLSRFKKFRTQLYKRIADELVRPFKKLVADPYR